MVSVSNLNAEDPGSNLGGGQRKFSDGTCKYLLRMSCSFVEIMRLFVVSVCMN